MCSVDERIHRAEAVDDGYALARSVNRKLRSEQAAGPILFGRKRAFGQIERNVLEEPSVVIERLRFPTTEWINSYTKTRSPLISKGVSNAVTGRTGITHQSFLFPADTKQTSNVLVKAPRVLCVPGMVVGKGAKDRFAKLRANNLHTDGD